MASVRDTFFNEIYRQVEAGEDIYVITSDLGAPSLDDFRRDFPERYISVGIAEQNLISVAAGMAIGGKKVIAYGLNPFPITRAFDQIRCLLAEIEAPITLCGLNAGLCSAECGYTHMPIEDMAMLRTLSNIDIYNPTDETISKMLAESTKIIEKPRVIRFDKALSGELYATKINDFNRGFGVWGYNSAKTAIVTNGIFVPELLREKNDKLKSVKIIDLFRIPFDEEEFIKTVLKCDHIITVEENVKAGGLGSMVLEILSDNGINIKCTRFGLDFKAGYYNIFTNRKLVRELQGITIEKIIESIG